MTEPAIPVRSTPAAVADTVERYFEISLYLLVVAGFTTIAGTGRLDFASVAFVFAALIARGYLLVRNCSVAMPERWTAYFTLVYVAFYPFDYFFLSGSFVTATVHLVLFAMVVKIFSVRRDRDYVYLAVLAFLEVLAASVLTVDTVFLMAFSVFLLLAVSTFISMEMRRASRAAVQRAREPASVARRLPHSLSWAAGGLVVSILLAAGIIFFILPRLSAGYLSEFAPQNEIASGFSNEVNLGKIGQIQQLNAVVMHVQVYGDRRGAHELLWRGMSLGLFDGVRWANPPQELQLLPPHAGSFHLSDAYPGWHETGDHGDDPGVRYRVLMEPIGTNIFFLAGKAESLTGPYRQVLVDAGGAVYNGDHERPFISTYEAMSRVRAPKPGDLRTAGTGYPYTIQLRYLQLPKHLDPRLTALAQEITSTAATPYDKAAAMEAYLRTRYRYTLTLPSTLPRDPVAHFLLERKQGHCEYFASAMTVLLRTAGIPSRLVTGFRGGEFNDLTGSYIIRARDAHSWVEAYFPGHGWVPFDPTPAGDDSSASAWNRFLLYVDAGREFWREWVVNYDFIHQQTLSTNATVQARHTFQDGLRRLRRQFWNLLDGAQRVQQRVEHAPARWGGAAAACVLVSILLMNGRRLWRGLRNRRIARAPGRAPQHAAAIWYSRLTRRLGRRGWRKLPAQTPQEFVDTIADLQLRSAVALFTGHYQRARFGNSTTDAERLPELYAQVLSRKSPA